MPSTSIDELFAATLRGGYDDDAPWEAVHELRKLGTRDVFDIASAWCDSSDPLKRARGLDVLAQLGKTAQHLANSFPEGSFAKVSEIVQIEKDIRPLSSAIHALGHLDNVAAVPLIVTFREHVSADVRFAVACALGSFSNSSESVQALLSLSGDTDDDVRDWATFGIGVLGNLDSTAIRDALYSRLSDPNEDVREEAMVGLAKRKDQRVLPALRDSVIGETVSERVAEAASFLLGMDSAPPDWNAERYRQALAERYPSETPDS